MSGPVRLEMRDALDEHREAWDELAEAQPLPSPFQRAWWLEATAADPIYLLVLTSGRLVGGLALRVVRRGGVTRYRAPGPTVLCPDHLDLLAASGHEAEVSAAVAGWFGARSPWILDVAGVVDGSLLARTLDAVDPRTRALTLVHEVAPYEPVEPGADWLAGRSSSLRRSIRRGTRRLATLGFEHRRATPAEVPTAMATLRRLHSTRPDRGPLLSQLDRLTAALSAGVALGEARVDSLGPPERAVAVSVAFELAGRVGLYQVARSTEREHDGAGTVLLAAVVADAVAGGCHEVDLLRGDEGYKSSFATDERRLVRVRAAHGALARVELRTEDLLRDLRRVSARRTSPGAPGP